MGFLGCLTGRGVEYFSQRMGHPFLISKEKKNVLKKMSFSHIKGTVLTRKTICWHQLQDLFIANFFQTLTFLGLEIDTHASKDPFIG